MINKAVILAGGLGTRFLPFTKSVAKEMLPVLNKPALQLIAEEAQAAGIAEIAVVISPEKDAVRRHFAPAPALEARLLAAKKTDLLAELRKTCAINVTFIVQEQALGSAHAVACARDFTDGAAFVLLNGDDLIYSQMPVSRQLADCFDCFGKSVIGVQPVPFEARHRYGVLQLSNRPPEGRTYFIDTVVEKPAADVQCSNLAAMGRYLFTNDIFSYIERLKPAANGELQLTDAINAQVRDGGVVAYDFEGRRYDLGTKQGFLEANIEYALRDGEISQSVREYLNRL